MRPIFHSIRILSYLVPLAAFAVVTPASAQRSEALLVSPAWLAGHLHDPNLVLLQVGERSSYNAKHIPGARFIAMEDLSVSDMQGGGRGPMPPRPLQGPANGLALEMPTAEQLRSQLVKFGISDNSRIVVYQSDDYFSPSTRIAFTLDYAGLGAQTSILDGGIKAWEQEKHETTAAVPASTTGKLSPRTLRATIVDAEYVRSHANKSGVAIVDGRSAAFYDGVSSGRGMEMRPGHIPGAHSVPFDNVFDDSGKLKSVDQLKAIFTKAGVQPADTVVGYCHVGQQATAMLFAARVLGHPVLLYDGSMDDWDKRQYPLEVPAKGKP